ncbi:MAG: hypothetical protein ACLPY3_24865 [Solirubrobacteraceae bacterium]
MRFTESSAEPFNVLMVGGGVAGLEAALSAHVTRAHGSSSQITESPTWSPPSKIAADYLAPHLEEHDRLARSSA